MSFTRISIEKDEPNSRVLNENLTVFVPREEVKDYVTLLKRTWPKMRVCSRNVA